ncbi:MAG: hypothetical protein MK195_09005, partial [Acidimicrobiales bacterium]|nr:hypothetical protein [Acidimicrobiales bacterium]
EEVSELSTLLNDPNNVLRPAEMVMKPASLGAVRMTRFSFSRSMIRRAFTNQWEIKLMVVDFDELGRGHIIYRILAEEKLFHFVAFTSTIDEALHTDRVIADVWDVTAALVEGEIDNDLLQFLRDEVPKQELSRLDPRVLVLTRGNRSVRFYDYLVERLADGKQPESKKLGDAGYIMRSTAFYGNGKFGMRSFLGFEDQHPLSAPYRAQFLAAWLFREVSYESVEHCAKAKNPNAVSFNDEWSCFFGLGNATGLGLVPWAMKHPGELNSWIAIRELALSNVRFLKGSNQNKQILEEWFDKAYQYFSSLGGGDRWPWMGPDSLAKATLLIHDTFRSLSENDFPFNDLYLWAEKQDIEITELVISILLELDDTDDEVIDSLLMVGSQKKANFNTTVADLKKIIEENYLWLNELNLDETEAKHYWWVMSDNAEEPRRAERSVIDPAHREIPIDISLRINKLLGDLHKADERISAGEFLHSFPEHGIAIKRLLDNSGPYSEPRENVCDFKHLPLNLQRFQLAMYGMDNFSPQSTDWLRVTLFQGAPRVSEIGSKESDKWILPKQPGGLV